MFPFNSVSNANVFKSEERVFCSGIDPTIVELNYTTVNEDDKFKAWVKSNLYYNHTHDVRSILVTNNQLISCGELGSLDLEIEISTNPRNF
jgi:hypothetical protein